MTECERKTDSSKTSYVSPSFPEHSSRLSQSETSPTENNAAVSFEKKGSQRTESLQHANPYFGTHAKVWDVDENHAAVSESSHSTQLRKESTVDSTTWGNKAVEQQDAATSGDSQSLSLEEAMQLAAEAALSAPSSGIQASYSGSRSVPSDRAKLETLDDCSGTVVDTLRSYDLVDKGEKSTTIETVPDCAKSEDLNLSNDTESTQAAKASARENGEEIQGGLENEGGGLASGHYSTKLANEKFLGMPATPFDTGMRSNTPFMSPSAPLHDAAGLQGSSIAHLTSQDLGDSPLLARVSSSLHGDDSSEIIEMGPPAIISDDLGQEYLVQPVRRSIGNDPRLVGYGQEMHYGNVEPGSGRFDSYRGENSHETVAHQSPRAPRMSDDGVFDSMEGFTSHRSSTNLERGTIHESIEPITSGNAMFSLMAGTPRAKGQRLTAAAALQTSSDAALPRTPLECFHSRARSNGHGSPATAVEPVVANAREQTDHESDSRQQPMIGRTRFGQPRLHFEEGKGRARTPSMSTDLGFYAGRSASTDGINMSGELTYRPQSAGAFETVGYGHRTTHTSIDVRQLYLDGVLRYCSEFGHHATSGRNLWNTSRASRMSIPIEVEFRERLLQRKQTGQAPSVPSSNMNEAPKSSTEFKSSSLSSHEDRLFYYYHSPPHRRSISDDVPHATPSLDLSARMSEVDIKDVLQAENNRTSKWPEALLNAPFQRDVRTENGMAKNNHDANEIFSPFSMMKGSLSDSSPSASHASEGKHWSRRGGYPDGHRQDDRTDERGIKGRLNAITARLPSSPSSSRAWGSSPEPPPSRERSLEESLRHGGAGDESAGADGRTSNGNTSMSREKIDGSLSSLESSKSVDLVDEWMEIKRDEIVLGPRIGIGSFGEVFKGQWRETDVAVKKFLDQGIGPNIVTQFRKEVAIMKRLRHPNIVQFIGACTQPPDLCIITQFVPRGSLFKLLHRSNAALQLDHKRKLRMALDVARGMNYLHSCKPPIIHRDLKSPNLLVEMDLTIKVCDFGLSRIRCSTMLSAKSQAGTPEWTAPEVLRGGVCSEASDVYSFGVILWEIFTGEEPWNDRTGMQVVGAVGFSGERLLVPESVGALKSLIQSCFDEPEKRPSFREIISVLKHMLKECYGDARWRAAKPSDATNEGSK